MITIYHNPRCGKSREALQILEEAGCEFEVVKYLENNISKELLLQILEKLQIEPIDLVRKNETIWKENFKNQTLSNAELVDILVQNPILIERPIVINGNQAIIGRPPILIKNLI